MVTTDPIQIRVQQRRLHNRVRLQVVVLSQPFPRREVPVVQVRVEVRQATAQVLLLQPEIRVRLRARVHEVPPVHQQQTEGR